MFRRVRRNTTPQGAKRRSSAGRPADVLQAHLPAGQVLDSGMAETSYWQGQQYGGLEQSEAQALPSGSGAGTARMDSDGIVYNGPVKQSQFGFAAAVRGNSMTKDNLSPQDKSADEAGMRFLLWIDAVGGYMVCLDSAISIGQAAPGNQVSVPILGDISRRHAVIHRHGDEYVLEPLHPMAVDGNVVTCKTLLSDGDELQLGPSVRLRFRKPHALSASAKLEFVSHHRTQPTSDGVLLMAESCVMGPRWKNHVVCRDWSEDLVLFRQDDGLFCRAAKTIEIDGKSFDGKGLVKSGSHVTGDDFSLSLEQI